MCTKGVRIKKAVLDVVMLNFNIFMDKFMNKHWILDENRCSHGCLQNTDGKIRILCSSTVRSIEP